MLRFLIAAAFAAVCSISYAQTLPTPNVAGLKVNGTAQTFPASGSIAGTSDTQTLTNKTISGSANSLSNIGNGSLVNSSITVNGQTCTLGGACAATPGCVAIEAFGGKGNGSTDNLAAWNAAVTAFGSNPICITFGAGDYDFSGPASATTTAQSISVFGAGKNVTRLHWTAVGNGLNFTTGEQTAVGVRDISLISNTANTSGNAITINSSDCVAANQSSTFSDIDIVGNGNYPSADYWKFGITLNNLSDVNVRGVDINGGSAATSTGITFRSTGTCAVIYLLVSQSNFINLADGIVYGALAQGVFVNQSNFTNGGVGIIIPGSLTSLAQLVVTASQFNTTNDQISVNSPIAGMQVIGCYFLVPSGHVGVSIPSTGGNSFVLSGNNFYGVTASNGNGISVSGTASGGVITGNTYSGLAFGNVFGASTTKWNVQSNSYAASVTTPNSNSAGSANTIGGGST